MSLRQDFESCFEEARAELRGVLKRVNALRELVSVAKAIERDTGTPAEMEDLLSEDELDRADVENLLDLAGFGMPEPETDQEEN